MISKLLLYLVWTAVVAALSSLNPDHSVASIASSHPASTSFGSPAGSVALQKRTNAVNQTCDAGSMSWFAMVAAYAYVNLISFTNQLNATFVESGMVIGELPKLASSYYDVDRVWCNFFPRASDKVGTSFPRCLLETAIDDFCTVPYDTWMNNSHPMSTNNRGGRWTTYKFTGYSISGLYVGAEFSKQPECDGHYRGLYAYNGMPDRRCKEKLLGQIVDNCQTDNTYIKFGGATTDSCETWVIYPLPPFQNATGGSVSILSATTTASTAYSLCGTTSLAGVFPTSGSWSTPTAASQATLVPESVKTDFRSADTTGTTEGGRKIKRTDVLTNLVARETGKAAPTVPAGPGRRQLVGL